MTATSQASESSRPPYSQTAPCCSWGCDADYFCDPCRCFGESVAEQYPCGQRYRQQPFSLDIERPHRCHRNSSRRSRFNRRGPACPHGSGAQPRHFAPNVSITSIRPTIWALNSGRASAGIVARRAGLFVPPTTLGSTPTRISAPSRTESVK